MIRKSIIIITLCIIKLIYSDKLFTNELNISKEKEICTKGDDGCQIFNNCRGYQVTPIYTDYGCTLCEKGYLLMEDSNGSGVCVKSMQPFNCIWKSINPLLKGEDKFCWECEKGYVLSEDWLKCTKLSYYSAKIKHCNSYVMKAGKLICLNCKSQYTLSEDGLQCLKGCNIENCESCQIYQNKVYCQRCSDDTVGVYETETQLYPACLVCKTWECKLLTQDAEKCCLKDNKELNPK